MTTDQALLSPDSKEIWYTSNAEPAIYVLETTANRMTVVMGPTNNRSRVKT
jgi:hypothetical protein